MCGIVGTVSRTEAATLIFNALKKLEYRGYDSAGVAMSVNSHLEIRKGIGKLDEVEKNCGLSQLPGTSGIGHTRWATHGGVTTDNAHPHTDCTGKIAVVHNGIIENYRELRDSLSANHKFTSETDTEVISHLIEDELNPSLSPLAPGGREPERGGINPVSLERAVFNAVKKLKGSYALLVISSLEPQKVVAARKDSPLVIGLGDKDSFLASDILCFLDRTNRVIYVEDGETIVMTAAGVRILDKDFRDVRRQPVQLDYTAEETTKQGNRYFMHKEILEQPRAMRLAISQNTQQIMDMAMDILRAKQVILTACGTSRHAALIGRYAFSKLAGKFSDVIMASEFQYFSDSVDKGTLVIAISQSGETADVIQGVRKAKENGAKVFSLVNVRNSTLARLSDQTLYLRCGPEIAVAATKSFVNQLCLFYLLAFAMENRLEEGIEKMMPVSHLVEDNLKKSSVGLAQLASRLKDKKDFYYLGRGINYAIAGEGALKLKEIAYVHAEGMPAGELKHGTLALIENGTPVIGLCPDDYTFDETMSNLIETRARGAHVIGVSDRSHPAFDEWIDIPKVEEIFYPLMSVIPLQLLAYHSALARGFDPDKPRNLAKSVTVK